MQVMTLLEFIKSKLSEDTEIGELSKDIQGDKEFPAEQSEEKIISYLDFKTRMKGANDVFKALLRQYKKQKGKSSSGIDIEAKFSVLRSENWKLYKEYFSVDKVLLVGEPSSDIYKVYCIDSSNKKALFFDLKSKGNLNDIEIRDENKIHRGNLTEEVTVPEAIELLQKCTYDTLVKPNANNFKELIEFLKSKII